MGGSTQCHRAVDSAEIVRSSQKRKLHDELKLLVLTVSNLDCRKVEQKEKLASTVWFCLRMQAGAFG